MAVILMYCSRLHAWWSTESRLATMLSSLIARGGLGCRYCDGSDLQTYLLMRQEGPDALAVARHTVVYLLDFSCSCIQCYLLLSPYLCFISYLYLDLYGLGDDALMTLRSYMQTKHLCVLIHI